jgi:hypothetical protein
MSRFERPARLLFFLLIVIAAAQSQAIHAAINGLGDDGWHTWQVPAVESAPEMCCFSLRSGAVTKKQCDLDAMNGNFGGYDDSAASQDGMQIFALMTAGIATKIRVFSSGCPVSADSAITDLGPIEADDSVEWLVSSISNGGDIGSDAIAAIAVHRGGQARDALIDIAKPGHNKGDREDAIFWMGQLRIDETATELKDFIFHDDSADLREHAAFSYSQSKAADVADVLIQQGRSDDSPEVRSRAWFWLAQTGAAESEDAIRHALFSDKDGDVREEAVFALSQLPDSRAIRALATILEDRKLDMDMRQQALFWLAQTESEEAFEYIDRLLSDN